MSPDGRLLIACASSHHVFVYDSITDNTANVVIGHKDFDLPVSGSLIPPCVIHLPWRHPDGKLAIGEYGNNRVLIYNAVPMAHGAHADHVLGQAGFFTGTVFARQDHPK